MKKRILASLLILATMTTITPISASADWKQDSKGWWYADGNSFSKGWKQIDGNWYYFNYEGYMITNDIINRYYINSSGAWSNDKPKEVEAYLNKLSDSSWINQYTNGAEVRGTLLDINQDGIMELLLEYQVKGHGLAGLTGAIVTYNNGIVKLKEVVKHGGFKGYLKAENIVFSVGGNQGCSTFRGYKIKNGEVKEAYILEDNLSATYMKPYSRINGKNVSKEEYENLLNRIEEIHFY